MIDLINVSLQTTHLAIDPVGVGNWVIHAAVMKLGIGAYTWPTIGSKIKRRGLKDIRGFNYLISPKGF